ncbi:type VI secretion system baseplate subunit TssG [Paraburkholderia aromaticivorans]|uniref:type VI secretion system baseplate subunit TssG n=1 Tax=Paraburkholderia aromaticivorans TaxID=2026199 RepID=UPI0014561D5A|nr:type VI secretion system baseplate subunit TssG [Paraburkholderia aromaticivorans]
MRDALELERTLQQHARHFDFFQALRLIDCSHPQRPRLGTSPGARDDVVRLAQDAELIFHPSALSGYTPGADGKPGRLAVNFLGLLGPNGPLPTHLTAYVRERERHANDRTLARFLDMFHHRMLTLFYRAWAAAQPVVSADRADEDRFSAYLGSLFGLGTPALRERDTVPDHAKLHFAGLLAAPTRHAGGLRLILAQFFGVPVEVEPWSGHWLSLPVDQQTRLGGVRLGLSSVVGTQVWDCQHKFQIVIGPLGYETFQRFLPGGASLPKLVDWVRNYLRDPLDWDVELHLRHDEVPALRLGGGESVSSDASGAGGRAPAAGRARLGWTTWLSSGAPVHDKHRVVIAPSAHVHTPRQPETLHG